MKNRTIQDVAEDIIAAKKYAEEIQNTLNHLIHGLKVQNKIDEATWDYLKDINLSLVLLYVRLEKIGG